MLILRGPRKNLELTHDADGWKDFLADPEKQWKDGRSAKMMAEAWEAAAPNLPSELTEAFAGTPFEAFDAILAIPEYQVDLPGGRAASQNDLFVLGRIDGELAVLMVEGKVDESFGPLLSEWLRNPSPGKLRRLAYLQEKLGLEDAPVDGLRYQLLHRTASPLIEAERLGARYAAMVVHSFSPTAAWFDDYRAFAQAMGAEGSRATLERLRRAEPPDVDRMGDRRYDVGGGVQEEPPDRPGASRVSAPAHRTRRLGVEPEEALDVRGRAQHRWQVRGPRA